MYGKICIALCLVAVVACVSAQKYPNHPSCPRVGMAKCFRKDDVRCGFDSDCASDLHCCDTLCGGRACTNTNPEPEPEPEPEISCPMYAQVACFRKDDDLCDAASNDCPSGSKCCGTQCGGTACYSGPQ